MTVGARRPVRIVVTGSECTGKTTLAQALAEALGVPWVPEYARTYAEAQGRLLDASDVEPIARGQIAAEDAVVVRGVALAVLDTDLVSTVVYARHYYGACPAWVEAAARARLGALYLLCDVDLPWQADGVRDRPRHRTEFHAAFVATLEAYEARVALVRGVGGERLALARHAVEGLI
jgi:NadR type nicotinamide-nucleotide adenylyltransferase